MDLNAILSQFTGNIQQRQGQTENMVKAYNADSQQIQDLLQVNEQQTADVIKQSTANAAQEAEIGFKINTAIENNIKLAGMDDRDANNQYVSSLATLDAEQARAKILETQRAAKMREVESLAGASLLDNPLGYLVAQLALPQVASQHNAILNQENEALMRRDAAAKNVVLRSQLIAAKNSVTTANTAEMVKEVALNKAKAAEQSATIQLQQAKADNISKMGARALDAYRLAGDTFQLQSDLLNKTIQIEQWKVARAEAADNRMMRRMAMNDKIKKDKIEADSLADLNTRLAAASASLGYETPVNVDTLKLLPKARAERILDVAITGQFGGSLLEGIQTVQTIGSPQAIKLTNPGMGKFIENSSKSLESYVAAEERKMLTAGQRPDTKAGREAAMTNAVTAYEYDLAHSAQSYNSNANLNSTRWDDNNVFNPYRPQYLMMLDAVEGGAFPGLKENRALSVVKTLRTQLGSGVTNLAGKDMENLVGVLAEQVSKQQIGLDKATADLAQLHQVSAAQNLKLYNYTQFGLPQQTKAIVTLPPVNMFTEPFKMDLMDPASIKANLARMAREKTSGTTGALGGIVRNSLISPIAPPEMINEMIRKENEAKNSPAK